MLTAAVGSFYLILLSADRAFFERLVRGVALVSTFVAVYGIGEWLINGGRTESLLGNAAFLAGYLVIAFFATLAAAGSLPQAWRRAALAGAALQVVAIVLTDTRGSILALILSGIIALAFLARYGKGRGRRRSALALGAVILGAGLFFAFRSELAHVPFGPLARIASISAADPDVASRLFIWKNMLGQIEQHPLLGVGAEHIDVLFNKFYDPTQIAEEWFDRSHNAFIDYAAEYGVGGFLLYAALIGSFLLAARRLARRGQGRLAACFALLAVTYAAQQFFVFDTISSFWLVLALLASALALAGRDAPREALPLPAWTRGASWLSALVLILLIVPASIRPALAAADLLQGYKYQLTDVAREVSDLSHGLALGTYGALEYGYEAEDMYVNQQAPALTGPDLTTAYQATVNILTDNFNRFTYDARTALYLAQVLSLAPAGATVDDNLLSAALARAIQESPKRPQSWYILVNLSLQQANTYPQQSAQRTADYAAAEDILNRYIALVPNLSEPHYVLAQLEYAAGDAKDAAAQAALGKADYLSDLDTAQRAAGYYETVLDLPDAAFFLGEVIRLDPSNAAAASDLAKIKAYEQSTAQ